MLIIKLFQNWITLRKRNCSKIRIPWKRETPNFSAHERSRTANLLIYMYMYIFETCNIKNSKLLYNIKIATFVRNIDTVSNIPI